MTPESRGRALSTPATTPFEANGRAYAPPARPVVVVCIDGCADDYLDEALLHGRMPCLARLTRDGHRCLARTALPSFTNTNNASIVTGAPPSVHGIAGNFFLDPDTGDEVMMNSSRFLRCETILAAASRGGRKVAFVTAKDKLREVLSKDLDGIAFSAEKANEACGATHGIDDVEALVGERAPAIYSADASVWVLRAGAALLERGLADFLYLSTTDYVQHRYAPREGAALEFYGRLDRELERIVAAGAAVGITADHGMNAKQDLDGRPNVIYLESLLAAELGDEVRVILPITDPYVVHHGALGSFAVVHLPERCDPSRVREAISDLAGITEVLERDRASRKLELPADRIGDLVVLAGRDVVIGRTPAHHDLGALEGGLRSHGGRYEEMVPFVLGSPLSEAYARRASGDPRNFDIFDFTVNGGAK